MTARYTRKALRNLVNYANETVPPCDGCAVRFTPREAAERFISWLLGSTCAREAAFSVYDFAYEQGIRL